MSTTCLLCSGEMRAVLEGVRDTRFGVPGTWSIRECRRCGLEQTHPLPSASELKALYESHYNFPSLSAASAQAYADRRERFLMSPLYQLMLAVDGDISFHGVRGGGRLLDVGCNEGRGLTLYRRNGFDAEGLELNSVAAATARARGFVVHEVLLQDFRPERPYDRVVLSNVLEHALDPRQMLGDVHRLLKPGGEVWISLPNGHSWLRRLFGRAWINWHVPFHITHFSADRLRRLLAECGFTIVEERQITPALWVAQSVIAWAFPGRIEKLRSTVPVAAIMLIARGLLFPLLWLGNRLGAGDCLVVRARRA
jgi:2-polyprenyl-3-methyl-5-hydroxy-6-metoxy-1,4-benzoquinol methylase